jgi:hypothetical protein
VLRPSGAPFASLGDATRRLVAFHVWHTPDTPDGESGAHAHAHTHTHTHTHTHNSVNVRCPPLTHAIAGDAEYTRVAAELTQRSETLVAKYRDMMMKDSAVSVPTYINVCVCV